MNQWEPKPRQPAKRGQGVILGKDVLLGTGVTIWNYVVVGEGSKIGMDSVIGSFCDIGKKAVIGKRCTLQAHITISNECELGDDVFIAPNSSLLNDKYPVSGKLAPVIVKNGAVIGGGVTILPGVTIGEYSVIGGGAVVTQDVPAKTVHVGIPARELLDLEKYLEKRRLYLQEKK